MLIRIAVAVVVGVVAAGSGPAYAQAPICSWTDNPIVAGRTPIKAQHLNEIRGCLDAILANWPDTVGPPPPPPGGADVSIHNVRRHQALDDVAHWIRFAVRAHVAMPRVEFGVRVFHQGGFFSDCTESFFDLDAGEQQDGLVIPSICGSDVQWTHFAIQAPEGRSCAGCQQYSFGDVPVGRSAPTTTLNAERAVEEARQQER